MEEKLLNLLKRMAPTKLLLLNMDRVEMMILTLGLELIRFATNTHFRGIVLGSADRLDHLLNVTKAAIMGDDLEYCSEFAVTTKCTTTVWNDDEEDKKDFLRSHMIHFEMAMSVGYGWNVIQKKSWNGRNFEGLKITEKDMKTRKFRIVIFNEDLETKFESPVFDQAKGTYNPKLIGEDQRDKSEALDQPLLPTTKEGRNRIIIR